VTSTSTWPEPPQKLGHRNRFYCRETLSPAPVEGEFGVAVTAVDLRWRPARLRIHDRSAGWRGQEMQSKPYSKFVCRLGAPMVMTLGGHLGQQRGGTSGSMDHRVFDCATTVFRPPGSFSWSRCSTTETPGHETDHRRK